MSNEQIERLTGRLVELRAKARKRSIQVLLAGMERISSTLDSPDDEVETPARNRAKLPDFSGDPDEDYPEEGVLDELERELEGIDDEAEPQNEAEAFTAAFQAVAEIPDRIDDAYCRLVAEALVCLRLLLEVKNQPAEALDELEDNLEEPKRERGIRWNELEAHGDPLDG